MTAPLRPGLVPTEGRPKRFRLSIVGADEDVPRVLRAYGRACDGEFGLVMRPGEGQALLVLIRKDGALSWRASEEAREARGDLVRARAEVVRGARVGLRILDGAHEGITFQADGPVPRSLADGDTVTVEYVPDDQFARIVDGPAQRAGGDAPRVPNVALSAASAVAAIRSAQKSVPKVGPTTLRGRWTGYLYCEGGAPRVELKRRLASYGSLWVYSNGTDGWAWTFERDSKWFGKAGETSGKGPPTLQDAIHIAVLGAMKLVQDACSFRDTRRRAAVEEDYAEVHPIKKREPKADPTDRMKVREPKTPRARKPKVEKPEAAPPKARAPRPAPAPAPAGASTAPPPRKPRTRKAPAAAATSEVDAAKDKALIDAFSQAFAAVLGEGA